MGSRLAKTFLIVATEDSADLHGAKLMEVLRRKRPGLRFVGVGGPRMRAAGLEALFNAEEMAVMGFVEVLPKLVTILRMIASLAAWAEAHRPAAAILIDSADFNLRVARRLRFVGIPTIVYVAPMAWAWRPSRTRALRDLARVLCIYPFEEPWFRARGVPATFVGNPLLEEPRLREAADPQACREALGLAADRPTLAILPGSRRAEIEGLLPTLLDAADRLTADRPELQVVIPLAPTLERGLVEAHTAGRACRPHLVEGRALEAMGAADAVALCSGTATLEAALLSRPMVVVYRAHPVSFRIAALLVDLDYVSIVNILAGRRIVPELLQGDLHAEALVRELAPLLAPSAERSRMVGELDALAGILGTFVASERAADEILDAASAPSGGLLPTARAV